MYLKYLLVLSCILVQHGYANDSMESMESNTGTDGMEGHSDMSGMDPMDSDDTTVKFYCTKSCNASPEDPCGNGRAQTATCSPITLLLASRIGTDDTFIGCPSCDCETACEGMDESLPMAIMDGTYCFPKGNGMYANEEQASLSAISRGCDGSHQMDAMFMIGSSHMLCMNSYVAKGVVFGEEPELPGKDEELDSSPSPGKSMVVAIVAMLGMVVA